MDLGLLDILASALGLDRIAIKALQPAFEELDELKLLVDENNKARAELAEVLKDAALR